jgi:hypothetical protein
MAIPKVTPTQAELDSTRAQVFGAVEFRQAPETPAPQPEPEANAIGVVARDANKHFSFEPTRTLVRSGKLTMQLINEGEDPHTMAIQRIGPGGNPEGAVTEISPTASNSRASARSKCSRAATGCGARSTTMPKKAWNSTSRSNSAGRRSRR